MKAAPLVNEQGYFIEDVLVEDAFTDTVLLDDGNTIVSIPVIAGLYKPRWDFNQSSWTEGMSAADIAALQPVATETSEQKITRLEQADLNNKELIATLYEILMAK